MFRVVHFYSEYILTMLMGNNNKMTENVLQMVRVQNQVIMCIGL